MDTNKRTCLYSRHEALGALISPFGGFDMPIQYRGIVEEHNAVRNACGIFDVSHMGEVSVTGPDAERYVSHIFTNDITGAPIGKIFYGMMLYPHGGTVDDLLVYKRDDNDFFLVINASNIDKDLQWMRDNAAGFDITITDLSDTLGEIAIQGPDSEKVMRDVLGLDCSGLAFYTFIETELSGEPITVSRTGYTGEDGFEIYASHTMTQLLWDKLIDSRQVEPCGLGCRDTLRFEVGLPLYGDELSADITPIEAGLGSFVKTDNHDFIGCKAVALQKSDGTDRKLVGLELLDRAIPRHGYEVVADGKVIGHVTTGYRGISVDKSIAMALIDSKYAEKGRQVTVRIRRKEFPAIIIPRKFYRKSYKK